MARQLFTWFPDGGASNSIKPAVQSVKFGDGYEQRTSVGINTMPEKWTLKFTGTQATTDPIIAFFKARKGFEAFDWKSPEWQDSGDILHPAPIGTYVCREWSRNRMNNGNSEISCVFEQVFEP